MKLRLLKLFLIVAYLAADYRTVAERISSLGISSQLGVFLILYLIFATTLFLTASIRNHFVRVFFAIAFTAASIFQQSFEWTTQGALTYDAFINLYNSRAHVGDALAQYGNVLLTIVPIALLLLFGIGLPPRASRIPSKRALGAPFAALALLSGLFYMRGGEGSRALPAAFAPVSFASILSVEELLAEKGPRRAVAIPRAAKPVGRDIVLLVDESIVGNYLDINNKLGVATGLGQPHPRVAITDYGYAASIHTCSTNSNVTLRYGGTRDNYQDTIAHYPSIWAYAHHAGLRTVYIDGQSNGGHLQNLMTPEESAEIDDFIQFDDVPVLDRDMAIAKLLADRINDGRAEFIYVNKVGAHFPVQDKFPDAMMRYRPVLERGHHSLLSWSSDRTGFHGLPEEWVRYRNSYRNTLLWNVGEFFRRLLTTADLDKATIIYTSDHGQDLHERGNPGNNTHCGINRALQEEGLVPLLVLEGNQVKSLDWKRHLAANHNGLSHFRIFPTLLALMGYDRAATRPIYGPTLDDPDKDPFSFNVLFNTRLGRKPEWEHIDLATVVNPPPSDYGGAR
jgi:glucan phosphoethanolaminetransferase (alkaline phosphatase superfamily)